MPVGKAYFGFTDEELTQIDRCVRNNTIERFGPVRAVRAEPDFGLVLEVAFEGLHRSTRHKSGVAMRFPRIARLRWDKPPAEADHIESLRGAAFAAGVTPGSGSLPHRAAALRRYAKGRRSALALAPEDPVRRRRAPACLPRRSRPRR